MRTECAEQLAMAMLASVGDRQMVMLESVGDRQMLTPRCEYCNVNCEYAKEQA